MENWLVVVGLTLIAYLLGSFPSGLVFGKIFKGVDVRNYGSGKIGATNSLRTLGWRVSLLVFVADLAKGGLSVFLPRLFFVNNVSEPKPLFAVTNPPSDILPWVVMVCAIACMLGHNYSIYIKFRGGRGVSAGLGAITVTAPLDIVWMSLFCVPIIAITRYVSLASLLGSLLSIIGISGIIAFGWLDVRYLGFAFATALFVIIHHLDNLQRLLNGTERKIGEKAKPVPPEQTHP